MKNKDSNLLREVPLKNYFIAGIIVLFSFVIMTYFIDWYANNMKEEEKTSIASDIFYQINSNELSNYLVENPNVLIYMADSNENNLAFEEALKEFVGNYYIKDRFIYLDTASITDLNFYDYVYDYLFNEDLKKEMSSFSSYTNIIYITEGKVNDLMYSSEKSPSIVDVKKFLSDKGIMDKDD